MNSVPYIVVYHSEDGVALLGVDLHWSVEHPDFALVARYDFRGAAGVLQAIESRRFFVSDAFDVSMGRLKAGQSFRLIDVQPVPGHDLVLRPIVPPVSVQHDPGLGFDVSDIEDHEKLNASGAILEIDLIAPRLRVAFLPHAPIGRWIGVDTLAVALTEDDCVAGFDATPPQLATYLAYHCERLSEIASR